MHTHTHPRFRLLGFLRLTSSYSVMSLIILAQLTLVCGERNPHIEISCDMLNPSRRTLALLKTDGFFRYVPSTHCAPWTMLGSWVTRMIPAFRELPSWWTDMWAWFQHNEISTLRNGWDTEASVIKYFWALRVKQCSKCSGYIKWIRQSKIFCPNWNICRTPRRAYTRLWGLGSTSKVNNFMKQNWMASAH